MSVQRWTGLGVMVAIGALLSPMARAEGGLPSRQALEQMGLGSLAVMSDEEALSVRGQGYQGGSTVRVFGNSSATFNGKHDSSHSENGYFADGKHGAKGSNFSFAGEANIWIDGKGGRKPNGNYGGMPGGKPGGGYGGVKIHATIVFAGGSSSAWAF